MGLDARGWRLVLGIELRLLQMVWPAGRSSTVSARPASLLAVAVAYSTGL